MSVIPSTGPIKCSENPDRSGEEIHRMRYLGWWPVDIPCKVGEPGQSREDRRITDIGTADIAMPVGRCRKHHQLRVNGTEGGEADAEPLGDAGPEVLENNVAPGGQLAYQFDAFASLEVNTDPVFPVLSASNP